MIKIYHGTKENRKLIATCVKHKEAFAEIEKHVKNLNRFNSPYYRQWMENGERVIDYGSHHNFYYMVFEN